MAINILSIDWDDFDFVFLARSYWWSPPHLDKYCIELIKATVGNEVNHPMFKDRYNEMFKVRF